MVHLLFHVNCVADLAVPIGAYGIWIFLILHGLDLVPVFSIGIRCRINGVRVPVAGLAKDACFICSHSIKVLKTAGPFVKSGSLFIGRVIINMALQTIGFVQPGDSWFDFIQAL